MSDRRDLVRNAADPQQVKRAERTEGDRRRRFLEAIGDVMLTENGRYFVWELLTRARVFASVVDRDPHMTYFNAGRQDYGHQLIAELTQADEGMYELMEREARQRARRFRDSNDAAHSARDTAGEKHE